MSWGRLDDGFYDHPKVLRCWNRHPAALGLHARAMSWVAKQETNGHLPEDIAAMLQPDDTERDAMVSVLVDTGLWHENGEGFVIHDYLDYNHSREELQEKRRRDRDRKRAKP